MTTMAQILASGDLAGYQQRDPLDAETARIDQAAAEASPCKDCMGQVNYEPYIKLVHGQQTGYRAFAVCRKCDRAVEF